MKGHIRIMGNWDDEAPDRPWAGALAGASYTSTVLHIIAHQRCVIRRWRECSEYKTLMHSAGHEQNIYETFTTDLFLNYAWTFNLRHQLWIGRNPGRRCKNISLVRRPFLKPLNYGRCIRDALRFLWNNWAGLNVSTGRLHELLDFV